MRLISCYIENFGGLQQFSYDFQQGLNVIFQENGWGKSTLASFLKAMLYGMEYTTKRSLSENERKKYAPWNGGLFGGNLTFEAEGKQYRVERFFGVKENLDSFALYDLDTGLKSNAYSELLGEELFGIDRVSFEQSIFMKQGMYPVSVTDSIAAKMSGLMASGDDLDCYEKACERLEAEMKRYKKIGNKGKIPEVTEEIAELSRKIDAVRQIDRSFEEWKKREEEYRLTIQKQYEQKEKLKTQIRKAAEQVANLEKSKHYQELLSEKEKLQQSLDRLEAYFVNGVPEDDKLEEYQEKLFSYKSKTETVAEDDKPCYQYPNVVRILSEHPLTEEELDACAKKWNLAEEYRAKLQNKEWEMHSGKLLAEEKAVHLKEKIKGVSFRKWLFAGLTVVLIAVAVILLFCQKYLFAIGAAIIALILLIVTLICMGQQKKLSGAKTDDSKLEELEKECKQLEETIANMKQSVNRYLHAFQADPSEDISSCISKIRVSVMEMKREDERRKHQTIQMEQNRKNKELLREELILFLRRFYQNTTEVEEYLFKEIRQKKREYLEVSKQYEAKCLQLEKTEPVKAIPEEEMLSMQELQREESLLERDIATQESGLRQVEQTIAQFTEQMEQCEKWEMEKSDLEELLSEYTMKYRLLERTMKYLKTAQTEFSTRYLKKLNEGFSKYANLFREGAFEHSSLDIKLAVKSEANGAKREIGYYSAGMKDTMELCVRLALIDALFEKEQPFVVLDDPFVNLDETAMEGAKKVLQQLAGQYQLIYFTCHPSRQ